MADSKTYQQIFQPLMHMLSMLVALAMMAICIVMNAPTKSMVGV